MRLTKGEIQARLSYAFEDVLVELAMDIDDVFPFGDNYFGGVVATLYSKFYTQYKRINNLCFLEACNNPISKNAVMRHDMDELYCDEHVAYGCRHKEFSTENEVYGYHYGTKFTCVDCDHTWTKERA